MSKDNQILYLLFVDRSSLSQSRRYQNQVFRLVLLLDPGLQNDKAKFDMIRGP